MEPFNPTAQLLEPEIRELVREGRYAELREVLPGLPPADVADILAELPPREAAVAFRLLPRDLAAEVFAYHTPERQERLIAELGTEAAAGVVEAMSPDDRARLLDELPAEVAQRILASLSPEQRRATQVILGYPPESVGRLMTPDYVWVRPSWTVAQALEHIRRTGRDAETVNVVYVIDEQGRLIDDIRLRQLLFAGPEQTIESLMDRQFIALRADQDQEEAVRTMARYDRSVLPVVDSRGVLLGIVTADDVADVAEAEVTEDIQKLGGMQALEDPYITTPVLHLARKRITWLAVLFVGEMFTQTAMAQFESEIERAAVLATFVPLIISSGGNSGSQATTLVIRALAVGEIALRDWVRVLIRECAGGLILGTALGLLGLLRVHLWGWMGWFERVDHHTGEVLVSTLRAQEHYHLLGVSVGVSVLGVVLWGTIVGSMLPFLLKRLRLDPATSSAPFVATLVDVTGVFIYFSIAVLFLRGTIL